MLKTGVRKNCKTDGFFCRKSLLSPVNKLHRLQGVEAGGSMCVAETPAKKVRLCARIVFRVYNGRKSTKQGTEGLIIKIRTLAGVWRRVAGGLLV